MSEEFDTLEQGMEPVKKRPVFLTVLAVLSFVSLGFALLGGLVSVASGPASEDQLLEEKVQVTQSINEMKEIGWDGMAEMLEQIQRMSEDLNDHFYLAVSLNLMVVALGIFAVLRMLKGFRMGFHLYIVYNLLSVVLIYAYTSPANIPTAVIVFNLLFAALFVFLYSRNLKWMTR